MNEHETIMGGRGYGKVAAYLHNIIQTGNFPDGLNSFQKHEIQTMYQAGKQYEAILKLQGLIDKPLVVKSKTLL